MNFENMTCEQIVELLPDYLQGSLDDTKMKQVEAHLAACAQCAEEAAVWQKLGSLPVEQPSPMLRARFDSMLEMYHEGRWETRNLTTQRNRFQDLSHLFDAVCRPSMSFAWAAVMIVAAFLGGRYLNRSNDEITKIHAELANTRQLVVLSMLQQQSPSERLQAVSYSRDWSSPRTGPDPKILSALLYTLRYDQNVNVRLAALDALTHYGSRPDVRKGLIDALDAPQSPSVQVALIDALVDMHDSEAIQPLNRLKQDPKVDPSVRKYAAERVAQMS